MASASWPCRRWVADDFRCGFGAGGSPLGIPPRFPQAQADQVDAGRGPLGGQPLLHFHRSRACDIPEQQRRRVQLPRLWHLAPPLAYQ